VLTLWVAVVAMRQGFSRAEGLSFGKAVAALFAQAKGRSVGVYDEPDPEQQEARASRRQRVRASSEAVRVFGRTLRARREGGELRAVLGKATVDPQPVEGYLRRAFGEHLQRATQAMQQLAGAMDPEQLGREAYNLYTAFRPQVAPGAQGWGQKGGLDLVAIGAMAERARNTEE